MGCPDHRLILTGLTDCDSVLKLIGDRVCFNKLLLNQIVYEPAIEPSIYTYAITSIEGWSAIGGGNCTAGGNSTYKGLVISTSPNPDMSDTSILYGSRGEGSFFVNIPNLTPDTSYYVRAFAYNDVGVVYDGEVEFSTPVVYTACATYDLDFYPIPSTTGFLDCGEVSSGVGATIGDYTIEWKYNSSTGETVFITGSRFEYDASIQAEHPLNDQIVLGGTLYPVVKSMYINSVLYSAYNIPGARYSPDLRNCLTYAIVSAINCDTSVNSDGIYPYVLTYNNTDDYGEDKSRTIKYDICPDVKYLAWEFDAETVAEQIQFYYCTSTNSTGILLDNFIHGENYVTTSLYPTNYPDGSAIYYNGDYQGVNGIKYITRFDDIPYSPSDYIRIEITGSILEPTNTNTNWTIKLASLYEEDIDCNLSFDSSISKISGDPSLYWNETACRYELSYYTQTYAPEIRINAAKNYAGQPWLWKYTDMWAAYSYNAAGYNYDTSIVKIGLRWETNYQTSWVYSVGGIYTCQNLNPGQSITISYTNDPDPSTIMIQFTDASDYNHAMSQITAIQADADYATWENLWATNASDDTRYFGYYMISWFDASSCGDETSSYYFYSHFSNDISYNETNKIIKISTNTEYLVNPFIDDVSCDDNYTAVNSTLSTLRSSRNRPNMPRTSQTRSQGFIAALWPIISNNYKALVSSYNYLYIHDAMLNGICDLSQYGFFKDSSIIATSELYLNRWMLFRYHDRVAFTSNASTHENRMQNWRFDRKIFIGADSSVDTGYETIYEVSLGVVL